MKNKYYDPNSNPTQKAMSEKFSGVYAILATPFDEQRNLDVQSLESLVEFEIKAGVNGLTILGILGEVHRLTDEERDIVTSTVVKAAKGRVPVISGTGASGTDIATYYTKQAEELGVAGVMIAPPRLVKPNDDAVVAYFSEIASNCKVPIIIQDEPATYGVNLSVDLISKLAKIQGVDYIKLEDPPTPMKITKIKSKVDNDFGIFGGLGGLYFYEELKRGACGIMTGFAYPELLCQIYEFVKSGDSNEARDLFYEILPLIRYEAQPLVSLAIRKEILKQRMAIRTSVTRPPSTKLDNVDLEELREVISSVGRTKIAQSND